jgi:hypothetical protein
MAHNQSPSLFWVVAKAADSIEDVPTVEGLYTGTMLVAHEFFDVLPFHLIEVRSQ